MVECSEGLLILGCSDISVEGEGEGEGEDLEDIIDYGNLY